MGRLYAMGAEPAHGGVSFRVWAPDHSRVAVVLEDVREEIPCTEEAQGYFSAFASGARAGSLYRYRLGGGQALPDPASRFQPEGPRGSSMVVDARSFAWSDAAWKGIEPHGQVLYELHIGTFTREGTYAAATHELARLRTLGVTAIELMPVAEFAGTFGWGYDGVDLWAPSHLYGSPDDLRVFVDAAHAHGLGVILDVVYNHLGPDGNYLGRFAQAYFTKAHENEWGEAINFDGEMAHGVREFFASNASYWIDEFHFDGLRFDATQSICDASSPHILCEMTRRARAAGRGRSVYFVGENEPQHAKDMRAHGIDALWNDDVHHSATVAMTGKREAYYVDHLGTPQELVSAAKWGHLFQGQHYAWQGKRRGTPALDLPGHAFVAYLENHDQVANSRAGARLSDRTSPGRLRAMTAYLLLIPATPMIFQGQELGSRTPFLYFADHEPELARAVRRGRGQFLAQFASLSSPEAQRLLADPKDRATFESCKLDASRADERICALHTDLLRLRRNDPVFREQRADKIDGAVIGAEAFVIRFFAESGHRLLVVNLGHDLHLLHLPEPLLAPRSGFESWRILWSSDDPRYGGAGVAPVEVSDGWHVSAHAAVVLG